MVFIILEIADLEIEDGQSIAEVPNDFISLETDTSMLYKILPNEIHCYVRVVILKNTHVFQ